MRVRCLVFFSDSDLDNIYIAGYIHDIGKCIIPPDIFRKKELAAVEWELIMMHPVLSYEIAKNELGVDYDVLYIVYGHHEKPGGIGYPDGIEPGYAQQVVCAADMIDAMTSYRGYRTGLYTFDDAINQVREYCLKDVVDSVCNVFSDIQNILSDGSVGK